jgi:hypothetical protein
MATRDITEGRGSSTTDIGRAIAVDLGIVSSTSTWQNTNESYDVAVGGLPFFYAINDERPYIRQTAPFNKEQQDTSSEPGEQSLTGWWMRSQLSFHGGTGIKFYDPAHPGTTQEHEYRRFADSDNVDVWTLGEVTLLKETANMTGVTTGVYKLLSIVDGSTNKILGWIPASTTINNYTASGTAVAYTGVTTISPSPLDTAILAIATNGTNLFIADNDHIYTGPIATPTTGYTKYYDFQGDKTNVVLAWVKQRLVAAVDASIYELTNATGTTHNLPNTATYTHPNASWIWSSISEGGSAIYAAGYAGGNSAIYKFVLSNVGVMPALTSGIVAAQLPIGEIVYKIESYLGYLMIGTNKGMRVAAISDATGDLSYGPLIFQDTNGVRDFAFRDRFVWATGTINGCPGLYRVDLGLEIEPLRFAYAKDAYLNDATGYATTVDFIGNTDQIAFTTSGSNGIAVQSATVLSTTGYIKTGKIRYGTLEPKNFKRLLARGTFTSGEFTLSSIATEPSGSETQYDHVSYNSGVGAVEVTTNQPEVAQEFLAYKFTFNRDATDTTTGPIFKGYQAKATIATPRQRIIQFPVYCFDIETDRFNTVVGYDGRAYARMQLLEEIEKTGDVLTWQDLTTGESQQAVIQQVTFTRMTPPDKRFDGFGGVINITIRTV